MPIEDVLSMLSAEIKDLASQANLVSLLRGKSKNDNGRLTEFGRKLIRICLEHQISQKNIALLLGISASAVNQHAENTSTQMKDNAMKKYDVINWLYGDVAVNVSFAIPDFINGIKQIPEYNGQAKYGSYNNEDYIMITGSMDLSRSCANVMGEICNSNRPAGITAKIKIEGEATRDGFVENASYPFMSKNPPMVLICLKKLVVKP
ncbi:hypothetical protein [Desulfovibrio sp. QI0442]